MQRKKIQSHLLEDGEDLHEIIIDRMNAGISITRVNNMQTMLTVYIIGIVVNLDHYL